jgi:hypothetical protein
MKTIWISFTAVDPEDLMPGGLRFIGDDGDLLFQNGIQQCRFTDIRFADERNISCAELCCVWFPLRRMYAKKAVRRNVGSYQMGPKHLPSLNDLASVYIIKLREIKFQCLK